MSVKYCLPVPSFGENYNAPCSAVSLRYLSMLLSIHHAQQSRRKRPSNVFRRFGRRYSFDNWCGDLTHPPLIFTVGQKCDIWRRLKYHAILSHPHLKMQEDIKILKEKCNAALIVQCFGQVW